MSRPQFLSDSNVTGTGWTLFTFGFNPTSLISIAADKANGDSLLISFDATNTHYRLNAGEPLNLTNQFARQIWLKPNSGTQSFRLYAY